MLDPARRRLLLQVLALLALAGGRLRAAEVETRFFRIGTGGTAATYFPLGSELASALSNPPGSRPCDRGGSCGVPGLIAVAQTTEGAVQNAIAVAAGTLESALCQADIASWAVAGTAPFEKQGAMPNLRILANLYAESLHVVVRADGPIQALKDLTGKRLSLGEPASGTLADAQLVLAALGLSEHAVTARFARLETAVAGLRDGSLDGVFQIAGYPVPAIADLARTVPLRLLPLPPETIARLTGQARFFMPDSIPAGTYAGIDAAVATVGIGSDWIASTRLDDDLAYALVKALWHDSTRQLLAQGHPIGRRIVRAHAVEGLSVPLHQGAARYYREVGLLSP